MTGVIGLVHAEHEPEALMENMGEWTALWKTFICGHGNHYCNLVSQGLATMHQLKQFV